MKKIILVIGLMLAGNLFAQSLCDQIVVNSDKTVVISERLMPQVKDNCTSANSGQYFYCKYIDLDTGVVTGDLAPYIEGVCAKKETEHSSWDGFWADVMDFIIKYAPKYPNGAIIHGR
ncbi:MAG: hypothetical protein WCQ53_03940 [bacterium]